MNYCIFIFYSTIFCYCITKISFFNNAGIKKNELVLLFSIKILVGLIYAWYYHQPSQFYKNDTYHYFNESISETKVLLNNPIAFIKTFFTHNYNSSGNLFNSNQSYWNNLKANTIIKLLAIINVFTFKNYIAAIPFFNFFSFFGLMAFYKLIQSYNTNNKWLLIISIFLLPSFLFWTSGVHKDGIIFSACASIIFFIHQLFQHKNSFKKISVIILLLLLVFALRNFVLFALLIAIFVWIIAYQSKKPFALFIFLYLIGCILFFSTIYLPQSYNFPNYLVTKHNEFLQLQGNSFFYTQPLQSTVKSFIAYLPTAIDACLFRPHFNEISNINYLMAFLENVCVLLFIIVAISFRKKNSIIPTVFLTCWFFALSLLLIEGYTVNFSGAIVRYKCIATPFIIAPLMSMIDSNKLKKKINFIKL